jgi:hypothetical protein
MSLPKEKRAPANQRARRVGTSTQSDAAYGQEGRVEGRAIARGGHLSKVAFAIGTVYGNRTTRGSAAHWALIEPSLGDPCTALCIIDRAPKPRAADGKLSEVS